MAEIQTLREVFRKEGLQFVHKLFDNFVIVSEKLNATRFAFEKNVDGTIEFYRKDGKITAIERTLNQIFEEPINYIQNLSPEILEKIPTGYRYGFRYFHSTEPINIKYDKIPLNGLVLTDIIKIEGNKTKVIDDIVVQNGIADLLMVDKPPVLWYGKLDDVQKTRLTDYLRTSEENLLTKFQTTSFTKYFISIVNPSLKKTALNDDIEKPVDSIIFKFIGDSTTDIVYAKAVDPVIQQIIRTNDEEREPQDMYGIILSDIVEFVKINGINKYKLEDGMPDEKFVKLMCLIYNDYIKKNEYKFEGVELDALSFTTIPKFDLNSGFIPNLETRESIAKTSINKNLFKIIVSSFSKPKRKPTGTMTQLLVDDLKTLSDRIKTKIDMPKSTANEGMMTFEDYLARKEEKMRTIKD